MIEVTLCMGSSCFSRGNEAALNSLEEYIEKNNLSSRISLNGEHCMGDCAHGPNIRINGIKYNNLLPDGIIEILNHYLEENHE